MCPPAISPCWLFLFWMNSQIEKWFADLGKIFNQSINLTTALSHLLLWSRLSLHRLQNNNSELFLLFSLSPHTWLHRTVTLTDPLPQNCTFCTKNSSPKKWTHSIPKRTLCCILGLYLVSTHLMHKTVNNETPSSKELIIRFRTHNKKSKWPRRKPAELCHY